MVENSVTVYSLAPPRVLQPQRLLVLAMQVQELGALSKDSAISQYVRVRRRQRLGFSDGVDLGIWLSPDPIFLTNPTAIVGAHPSHSAYGYANSNPLAHVDPDGEIAFGVFAAVVAVVVGITITSPYANAPTSAAEETKTKDLGAEMVENSVTVHTAMNGAAAVGCLRAAATGGVRAALATTAKVVTGAAAVEGAGMAANAVDPSGSTGKIVRSVGALVSLESLCFSADTPVLGCDGSTRPIEDIEPGARVLSRDPDTGEMGCRTVLSRSRNTGSDLVELRVETLDGSRIAIRATAEHPFWVNGRGWVTAAEVVPGEVLPTAFAGPAVVTTTGATGGAKLVYNLEVDQFHTYVVGSEGVWVHNNAQCRQVLQKGVGLAKKAVGGAPKGAAIPKVAAAAKRGQQANEAYKNALPGNHEHQVTLPSGKRPDAVDFENRIVRELKPDNPRAIRRGEKQVENYRQELEQTTGEQWTSAVDTYNP